MRLASVRDATRFFPLALAAWLALGSSAAAEIASPRAGLTQSAPRTRYTINERWRYAAGEVEGAAGADFRDSAWSMIDLPHSWNVEDAFTESLGYRRGVGWYRRRLSLGPEVGGKRIFLHFEGANQVADVYVNGAHAGRHIGGYTAFAFDVTPLVRFDRVNVVAVRVDNAHDPDIPPLNADFTFYGGIYRDVWLIAAEPVHLDVLDHASAGVLIDTPTISAEAATVRVRGTVVNATSERKRVRVVSRVIDSGGRDVVLVRTVVDLRPRSAQRFTQVSGPVVRPQLWSPDAPYLYRIATEVSEAERVLDRVDNPLGFRWFRLDPQRGFFLNGEAFRLVGTNRHQDHQGLGNALPNWAHRQDLRLIKETGFNFLRLAHYPQDPVVLEEADRLGLIIWEEIPIVNLISVTDAFAANSERMLVEMIRQHYNHPSVMIWGYMNEVMLVKPRPSPPEYRERVASLARRLDARARAEDATRATAMAISLEEIDDGTGLQEIPDVLGLNLYFGWYYHRFESLGPFLDSLHRRHPRRPLLVSEYGADSDERVHTLEPRAFDFSTEHQQRYHESQFRQLAVRPYLLGSAVWNQFDFGSKGRHDTKPNLNQKGLFYFDRTPKDIASYYRAHRRAEPVLHIATRDWLRRAGSRPQDRVQPVVVYTNLGAVELLADGTSLGVRRVENRTARWDVTLRDGTNRLTARGTRDGASVVDVVSVHYTDRTVSGSGAAASVEYAVNAGSQTSFVDRSSTVWEADRPYERGGWGHVGGRRAETHHRIFGTTDDPLYQSTHDGAQEYRFDVPDGDYDVELAFAEIEHERAGVRIFGVWVNEQPVFTELDLAAMFGRYAAVERTVRVVARGGEGVRVRFVPRAGTSTVSGILLRRR